MESNIYKKLFEVKKAGIKLQRDKKAFNYKYADLGQIQEKLNEALQEQGLLVVHSIIDNKVRTTICEVETEKFISSEIAMTEGTKAQDKGSEITYYRRYNLLSLLDLEVEDDDGKKAQDSKKEEKKWYNDFEKQKDTMIDKIKDGKTTPDKILSSLAKGGYSISAGVKEQILQLEDGYTDKHGNSSFQDTLN